MDAIWDMIEFPDLGGEIIAGFFMDKETTKKFIETNDIKDRKGNSLATWLSRFPQEAQASLEGLYDWEGKKTYEHVYNFRGNINEWLHHIDGYPHGVIQSPLEGLQVAWTRITERRLESGGRELVREICGDVIEVPDLETDWYLFFMGKEVYTRELLAKAFLKKAPALSMEEHRLALQATLTALGIDVASLNWACMFDPDRMTGSWRDPPYKFCEIRVMKPGTDLLTMFQGGPEAQRDKAEEGAEFA